MTGPKRCFLEMKMNDHDVSLKLDTGCDKPIINKAVWFEIGKPKLLPVHGIGRRSVIGVVPLKGVFLAKMSFAGINFRCPVHVSDAEDTRNLIGRRALPFLVDFDWNKLISEGTIAMVSSGITLTDDNKKQEMMADAVKWKTLPFYMNVLVDGKDFRMKLDTGATCSMAGLAKWKELGEPKLTTVKRTRVTSTSNQQVPLLGKCSLNITYNGVTAKLPLLIADTNNCQAVLGTNWYDSLDIDFNTIFQSLKFDKVPRTPPPKQPIQVENCGEQQVAGPSVSNSEQDVGTTPSQQEHVKVVRECQQDESPTPDPEPKKVKIVHNLKSSATSPSAKPATTPLTTSWCKNNGSRNTKG
ncbi:hypothetical protein DAPPUDRAFT_112676 [Daphnia pulex]|uniref:Peptidase A2 domain-containing protein n=1 Tax=Daphnia pulex TaxID=6669 RepID=E9HCR5_DAPPU|nr:hypothetical protein DAPPUDRAFT_112676 [Daphnia pulex]|eukprot:EFX70393.1 hypothetical protein DAPPUDRAFT_112676 [Daphnia pulex]